MGNVAELRDHAKQAGICWKQVVQLAKQFEQDELDGREWKDRLRRAAWNRYLAGVGRAVAGSGPFWRVGFEHLRKRCQKQWGGDYVSVPGSDAIADVCREHVPECAERSTQEIWDELFEPYKPRRPRVEFIELALFEIEAALTNPPREISPCDSVPF